MKQSSQIDEDLTPFREIAEATGLCDASRARCVYLDALRKLRFRVNRAWLQELLADEPDDNPNLWS